MDEQVLADRERILGPDHPDTLCSRNNLAAAYWQAGRTDQALALFQALLPDLERVLGARHPRTVSARRLLRELQPNDVTDMLRKARAGDEEARIRLPRELRPLADGPSPHRPASD